MTDARREPITVRLAPEFKSQLEDASSSSGLDVATIARLMIEGQLKRLREMEQPNLFDVLKESQR